MVCVASMMSGVSERLSDEMVYAVLHASARKQTIIQNGALGSHIAATL